MTDNQEQPAEPSLKTRVARRQIERLLGLEGLGRRELEQPLVFFRVGWEYRWLSRAAIVNRLLGEPELSTSINTIRDFDSPAELDAFCDHLLEAADGLETAGVETAGPQSDSGDRANRQPRDVERVLGATRAVIVLPGGWHRSDTQRAFRLGRSIRAAFVLPPEEGAWPWAVVWSRPSLIVAGGDQLAALATELSEMRPRKRRRALAKLCAIVPVSDSSDVASVAIDQISAFAPDAVEVLEPISLGRAT